MTRKERKNVLHCLKVMAEEEVCEECDLYGTTGTDHCEKDCVRMAIKALSQEPCTDAQERYEDLCEYFGDAKDILKSRKDFKAWLERVKWHIHKAEELFEKYEYKKEPCTDAVSRQAVLEQIKGWLNYELRDMTNPIYYLEKRINNLPSVTQKSGKWTLMYEPKNMVVCSECGKCAYMYQDKTSAFCPNCGAEMESEVRNEVKK